MNVISGRDRLGADEELVKAERALERCVRAEVRKEYESRLARAGRWRRCFLRWRVESTIRRRLGERLFARSTTPAELERAQQDRDAKPR